MTDTVNQEEVFGPFVTVATFSDDDEALAMANGVRYGLGAGLWTSNLSRAHRIAREINAGMVWVEFATKSCIPVRRSAALANPVTAGKWALKRCANTRMPKSVWINVDAQVPPHYQR